MPRLATFILVGIIVCRSACAALGENEASVETDRGRLGGVHRKSQPRGTYTVHEIVNEGLTVREYVSQSGVVFGLAWSGIMQPDLTQLLGPYFSEYSAASRNSTRIRGQRAHSELRSSNVIVRKSGHLRYAHGVAYAPSLLPEGMSADEIQ